MALKFIEKYQTELTERYNPPNLDDIINCIYSITLLSKPPCSEVSEDILDKFADEALEQFEMTPVISLMSLLLLSNIPCSKKFLKRLSIKTKLSLL